MTDLLSGLHEEKPRSRGRPVGTGRKTDDTLALIREMKRILEPIQPCSVRALCYQLFIADLIPSMAKKVTNMVGSHLGDARDGILGPDYTIPWTWIADYTRATDWAATSPSFGSVLRQAQARYRYDRWLMQPRKCLVLSEKDTVKSTLRPVLEEYGVDYQPFHGHGSDTKIRWWAEWSKGLKEPLVIFYTGDYDIAGMDMSESDAPKRFARYGANVEIRRIALTEADCLALGRNLGYPAASKGPRYEDGRFIKGDARYPAYVDTYGDWCWELDAMNPNDLRQRVEDAIVSLIDVDAWERAATVDRIEKLAGQAFVDSWDAFLRQAQTPRLDGGQP